MKAILSVALACCAMAFLAMPAEASITVSHAVQAILHGSDLGAIAIATLVGVVPMTANERRKGRFLRDAAGHPSFEVKDGGTPTDIPGVIEKVTKLFEEFKTANDKRIADLAQKGAVDTLVEQKCETINAEITKLTGLYKELEKKAGRPQFGTQSEKSAAELKSFNMNLASHAVRNSRPVPEALSAEQYDEYKAAFSRAMRKNDRELSADEIKTLSVGSDPDGGFLVPAEMETTIDRVVTQMGAMRSVAMVRPIGTASYKKPVVVSGASSGWAGETTAPSETDTPRISELEFTPGKLWAEPHATTDLLEDAAVDIEAWLADEVTLEFSENEGDAFVNGNGILKPRGILAYDTVENASYSWGKVGYVKTGGAASFAASNPSDALITLQHSLKRQYRPEAGFMMNDATLASIRKFKDANGLYMWQPNLAAGALGVLLGSPVYTDDFFPDLGANAFPVAFANWRRAYLIVDRRGITVLRDPYTRKPYVKFYTTRRVGGGIQNFEAIKLLKCEA